VFVCGVAGGGWMLIERALGPADQSATAVNVALTVRPGTSAQEIGALLERHGLVRSRALWVLAASRWGYTSRFQAGDYTLSPSMTGRQLMDALTHGTVASIKVTIPEGWKLDQIAREVAKTTGLCTATEFADAASDKAHWPKLGLPAPPNGTLEGYLFPDTYPIDRDAKPEQIIAQMVARLRNAIEPLRPDIDESGMTVHEVVTLASIIEREVKIPEERPIAAQVFLLRLKKRMKLQSCATVQYLLPEPKEVLLISDTKIESPYNTYLHEGLPPGPIGSPGLDSIKAVLHPADTDYLFFRTEGNGPKHHFSRTEVEHEAAGR